MIGIEKQGCEAGGRGSEVGELGKGRGEETGGHAEIFVVQLIQRGISDHIYDPGVGGEGGGRHEITKGGGEDGRGSREGTGKGRVG